MAQHDYIISNQSGAAFRQDLNNALAAIVSQNSGAVEPSTTYAYQFWADTTAGVLKQRNAANSAWITLFQLDGEWTTIALENGTAAAPSLYFKDSGTDTGVYSPGVDQVGVATAGVQRINFNGSTEVVVNDTGADVDFRIEGDTEPNLFVVDAGTDEVRVKNLNGGQLAGARNRIINGDMRINQRTTAATTTGAFGVDRWSLGILSTGAVSLAGSTATAPVGFTHSLYLDVTTADTSIAATEFVGINQLIEGFNVADLGFGTANAKTITLSFWIRSTTTGTYCVSFCNSGSTRSYVATYTINAANTWEYKTISITGDTSGTWLTDSGAGLTVRFAFAAGSNFQTTAGSWQAGNYTATSAQTNLMALNTNDAYISGVQLEVGSVATPFERRSYTQELALCQRYYCKTYSTTAAPGGVTSAGNISTMALASGVAQVNFIFPVDMRSEPSVTLYNAVTGATGTWRDGAAVDRAVTAQWISTRQATISCATATAGAFLQGQAVAQIEL